MLEPRLILVNLLIKLGVAAAVSSALVRSKEFKSLIFREQREPRQKIYLALWMAIPIALGVWIRCSVKSFIAGDLSLETALLLGVIGGRLSGGLGGALISLPAALYGEWASLPLNVFAGIIAGWLRRFAPEQEDIWSFSPFIDLSLYRILSHDSAQSSAAACLRLADCFFRDHRGLAFSADGSLALLAKLRL